MQSHWVVYFKWVNFYAYVNYVLIKLLKSSLALPLCKSLQRPLSFRKGFDALETLTIWAWALPRMGQVRASPQPWAGHLEWSLPPCTPALPACLPCPLQAGSVLSTQPLLRSQFSAQRKCFLCAHFSRWPPTLAWIETQKSNSGQTASLAMPYRHTSMQTHTRSPHPPQLSPPLPSRCFWAWSWSRCLNWAFFCPQTTHWAPAPGDCSW